MRDSITIIRGILPRPHSQNKHDGLVTICQYVCSVRNNEDTKNDGSHIMNTMTLTYNENLNLDENKFLLIYTEYLIVNELSDTILTRIAVFLGVQRRVPGGQVTEFTGGKGSSRLGGEGPSEGCTSSDHSVF